MLKAVRNDKGKPPLSWLPWAALREVANVLRFGAEEKGYSRDNWRGGFEYHRVYSAALRHLTAHIEGESLDPESGMSHLAHAATNILFLIEHELKGLGLDDRYTTLNKGKKHGSSSKKTTRKRKRKD